MKTKKIINFTKKIINLTNNDEVGIYSAQSSFFITLAIFPFIMMLLSIIMLLPNSHNTLISLINNNMPKMFKAVTKNIITDTASQSNVVVLIVTAITALWSSSKGILSMMNGLYKINENTTKRPYIIRRLISMAYTVAFALIIIITMSVIVFGNKIVNYLVSILPKIDGASYLKSSFRYIIMFFILFIFFVIVYKLANYKNTTIKECMPGSAVTVLGWLLFSFGFSIYVDKFSNLSAIYGAFTSLIIISLWVYFCMYIFFIGGEINKIFHKSVNNTSEIIQSDNK